MSERSRTHYLILIFFIGFAALVYEIYSVQVLFLFFVKHTQAVSVAISSFIAGLAVSSLIFSQMSKQNTRNLKLILWMQLAAAAYGFFVLTNYALIPQFIDLLNAYFESQAVVSTLKVMIMWFYLFIPAFFIGGAFPLINGLYLSKAEVASEETGIVYFWDMVGAIMGAMFAGFFLIPYAGLYITVIVPIIINLMIAIVVCQNRIFSFVLAGLIFAITVHTVFLQSQSKHILDIPSFEQEKVGELSKENLDERFGEVSFQKNSPFGIITVGSNKSDKNLFINYRMMCTSHDVYNILERDLARVTADNLSPGSKMANIGLGCGMTAMEAAFHKNVDHLHIIEINPVILEAARTEFAEFNNNVTIADHVDVTVMDGAEYMRTTDEIYNAIVIDIEEVSVIYSSPLFTVEYYEILKSHLQPGGIVSHWSANPNSTFSKIMYNTLQAVFKNVEVQVSENGDINFFASDRALDVPQPSPTQREIINKILNHPSAQVNTLEHRILEQYFDLNAAFSLPDDYNEKYIRKLEEIENDNQ